MPTYHFRCTACKKEVDRKLPLGSTDTPTCQTCNVTMTKFIVPPNVQFKGGGFYKTDARAKPEEEKSGTTAPNTPPTTP